MPRYSKRKSTSYSGYDKASRALSMAAKALAVAKLTKSLLNVERKESSFASSVAPNTTGSILMLNGTAQGLDKDDRVGNSVRWTSILTRVRVEIHASATASQARVIFIWDKQSNGALPAVTDVLQAANTLSSLNTDFGKRFRVLSDQMYNVSITGNQLQYKKVFRKLSLRTEFGTTAGTIAAINSGTIFLLVISDEATNAPTVFHNTKLRYIDN